MKQPSQFPLSRIFPLAWCVGVFFLSHPAVAAQRFVIDTDQSFVRIAVKMCEPDLLKGEFGAVSGEVFLDETHLENSRVTLTVSATDAVFDHEFHRSDNIYDIVMGGKILKTMKFPVITFRSTEVIPLRTQQFDDYGDTARAVTARVKGELTLVGVTRPFEMEVTFHEDTGLTGKGRVVAAFSAYGTFKRSDFGVLYGLDRVGIRRMGDEVMVMASITANRAR